ncbi:MAG: hypothetical protein SW833_17740 [Cyanobacteriota bacterium]|nr:hypothetical protein [Cyanobacteriota bacterium]
MFDRLCTKSRNSGYKSIAPSPRQSFVAQQGRTWYEKRVKLWLLRTRTNAIATGGNLFSVFLVLKS